MLQEAGMWRYAATLTAQTLEPAERSAALERWATHKHQACRAVMGLKNGDVSYVPMVVTLVSASRAEKVCTEPAIVWGWPAHS